MADAVEIVECKSAKEFLEKVVFAAQPGRIFRGLADADFELVPTIARSVQLDKINTKPNEPPIINGVHDLTRRQIISFESHIAAEFYQSAYKSGVDLPTVEEWIHFALLDGPIRLPDIGYLPDRYGSYDTHRSYWPVYARMQHLGLATRLLDWTAIPAHAAFFSAFRPRTEASSIAVWSLPTNFLASAHSHSSIRWERLGESRRDDRRRYFGDALVVYSPPMEANINIKNQSGLFTVAVKNNIRSSSIKNWEEIGAETFNHLRLFEHIFYEWENVEEPPYGKKAEREPAFCFKVSAEFSDEIIEVLDRMGVSGARLLSEGFAYGDLMWRSESAWLASETWISSPS